MYQILPLMNVFSAPFFALPVEMWCFILRLLDGKSLIAAARSSPLFNETIKGDPILKKAVESVIKEEQQEMMEVLTRPGMVASITRDEHSMLFGSNRHKNVTIAKSKFSLRQVKAHFKKREGSGRKARTATTNDVRFNPYRI